MITTTYKVKGMTCERCAQSLTSQLSNIDDVTDVVVDLKTGDVSVTSSAQLAEGKVREAVEDAGFELVISG